MLECFVNDPKAKVKWFKDGNQLEVRSKTCLKWPLKNRQNKGFKTNGSLTKV